MRDPVPAHKGQGSASTILVVEDEVLIRLHVAEELREAGFPVLEAADAGEALAILGHVDGVELIATDLRMPGELDGLALARQVRVRIPSYQSRADVWQLCFTGTCPRCSIFQAFEDRSVRAADLAIAAESGTWRLRLVKVP